MPQQSKTDYIMLGHIGAPYGIQGYNHIQSYTDPLNNILDYAKWMVRKNEHAQWRVVTVEKGRLHGQSIVARLEGITDRDAAQLLTGSEIAIDRHVLPPLTKGEYYWHDLEGLQVETVSGIILGHVDHLYNNAGHTNMVVKNEAEPNRERHIPFIEPDFVTEISLEAKKIIVDWDPDL